LYLADCKLIKLQWTISVAAFFLYDVTANLEFQIVFQMSTKQLMSLCGRRECDDVDNEQTAANLHSKLNSFDYKSASRLLSSTSTIATQPES